MNEIKHGPLEGWVIFLEDGNNGTLGIPSEENGSSVHLCPAYHIEGAMNVEGDPRTRRLHIETPTRVTPILGMVSLQRITVDARTPRIRLTELDQVDRARIAEALAKCEAIVKSVRVDRGGIAVVRELPNLPPVRGC